MKNDPKKPEVEPSPSVPVIPEFPPEIKPQPDKNRPERPSPETIPPLSPEIKPLKESGGGRKSNYK